MSKSILLPRNIWVFKHPHLSGLTDYQIESLSLYTDALYCVTERPTIDPDILPLLGEVVRDFTPCGQEIYWRLK